MDLSLGTFGVTFAERPAYSMSHYMVFLVFCRLANIYLLYRVLVKLPPMTMILPFGFESPWISLSISYRCYVSLRSCFG